MPLSGPAARRAPAVAALVLCIALAGCTSIPEEAYRLPPSPLTEREAQTQTFEADDDAQILRASAALLQDMEYNIDTIEYPLGILTASKTVDADDARQKALMVSADIAMVILSVLAGQSPTGGFYATADDEVGLVITLVVLPSLANEGQFAVRVTLQSTLIAKNEQAKIVQTIEDPVVYQEIFAKLSKSLYLEKTGR